MRISDWSSDVCSSDLYPWGRSFLNRLGGGGGDAFGEARQYPVLRRLPIVDSRMGIGRGRDLAGDRGLADEVEAPHIGRGFRDRLVVPREVVDEYRDRRRSEEHTSELQSLMRNTYAVFRLKKK